MDDFMNKMGLGDPDPSNYKKGFDGADEIVGGSNKINPMTGDNVTDKPTSDIVSIWTVVSVDHGKK